MEGAYEEIDSCLPDRDDNDDHCAGPGTGWGRAGPRWKAQHLCAATYRDRSNCRHVNAIVTAFNNRDTGSFQKIVAPDAVWLDEDGHHLQATVWYNRILTANPPRKLAISNLRVQTWDTGAWAGFNYTIEGTNNFKGTNSLVFKKTGNDWQVVLVHGAVDTSVAGH